MIYVNDEKEPTLIGILQSEDDIAVISNQVNRMNHHLVDSGFDQYQYHTVRRGNKLYIELIGA